MQLEQLLNQSKAYTQFLSEQLADVGGEEEGGFVGIDLAALLFGCSIC